MVSLVFCFFLSILSFLFWVSLAQTQTGVITKNSSASITVEIKMSVKNIFYLNSSDPSTTTWFNNNSMKYSVSYDDGSVFAIGKRSRNNTDEQVGFPGLVWSANRYNPVRENATLQLMQDGDLVLRDSDGTKVWSTDTSGESVLGMNITEVGNLLLFDNDNEIVWQSFDHPTDSLLLGQRLIEGQKLIASVSATNWNRGSYYATFTSSAGFAAFIEADRSLMYFQLVPNQSARSTGLNYARFDGRQGLVVKLGSLEVESGLSNIYSSGNSYLEYLKLDSDGHLRIYQYRNYEWHVDGDLVAQELGECQYPRRCGDYGVCREGQCSCPKGLDGVEYFKATQGQLPNLGCSRIFPLSCQSSLDRHRLVEFGNLSYFNLIDSDAAVPRLKDLEGCKQACLQNCSCTAAFFKYESNISDGYCYLPSGIMSIKGGQIPHYNFTSSAFIKVQIPYTVSPPPASRARTNLVAIIAGSIASYLVVICLLISLYIVISRKKKVEEEGEELIKQVPGMPVRFSYEALHAATEDFKEKLGGGGFGSVFKGLLGDGTRIAVKRFDNMGQGMKEFLAEVEIIGSIHHFNLVRLIGYCAEKSFRLLVYEYMSNGSLDHWIFHNDQKPSLDWETRKKIVLDVAKGLAYLHEECRQRIVHLDIKPQNILLDDNFNAKVSDFGLSELINRDESQVLTTMRGTPGYLAPEWKRSRITVKVDIYSFGIVVLEIVCGRKNLDRSQSESSLHLLRMLQKKAEEDRLIDIIDNSCEDMQCHREEAMRMIRIAAWCLQDEHTRRPPMSVVVKVLEGVMEVDPNINYQFSNSMVPPFAVNTHVSPAPQASILSAPR